MAKSIWALVESVAEKVRTIVDRMLAVRVVESSIVLAAQAFLALFPLIIIVYAIIPPNAAKGLLDELRSRLGISGESAGAFQHLTTSRGTLQSSLSVFSIIVVLGSATSFTRALQRVYQYAWELPKLGFRGIWRGFAWLLGVVIYLVIVGWMVHLIHNGGVTTPLTSVIGFGLWWWTQFLLLGGRVHWRSLVPGALLTSVAQAVVALLSALIVPREIRSNESSYGPIGAVFALESWFIVLAGVLVTAAAIGASVAREEGRIGTWIRGTADPDGWRRDVPPIRRRRRATPTDAS